MKKTIKLHLSSQNFQIDDLGMTDERHPLSYHTVGYHARQAIQDGLYTRGTLICESGMGSHIAAETFSKVSCALCLSAETARRSRVANDCNILALGAFYTPKERAFQNVVINEQKQTVAAFAGDYVQAHLAGIRFLQQHCQAAAIPGDVVITTNGGAPLDQNLYQCVKGLTAADATAKSNAVIILCAEMADGVGGEQFYRDMKECETPAQLFRKFASTPQNETIPDQWQTQILCRILMNHRVIFVTRPQMRQVIEDMKMEYAPTLPAALEMAGRGEITVVPDGVSVIICAE